MSAIPIEVKLPSTPYRVWVGDNLQQNIIVALKDLSPSSLMLVTDSNVAPLHAVAFIDLIKQVAPAKTMSVPAGENSKNLDQLSRLYDFALTEPALDRDSVVVALGGGMVGDLAGFFAATLMRGVRLVQIPTSLLAMLDSSVGGKTAVNHARGKNMIGAFHQPSSVFCDINVLQTLPDRELRSAISEAIKCALLGQMALFTWLENSVDMLLRRDPNALRHCVTTCVQFKGAIVEKDERETGKERILLNLGHTLGHAVETLMGGKMLHGEAIAIGLLAAMRVSAKHAALPVPAIKRIENLIRKAGFDPTIPAALKDEDILKVISADKKRAANGTIKFVVCPRLGHAVALDVKLDAQLIKDMRG
ncbi:MAG: 3-dehydroquinate synthase [Planctomycetes bacterium]|nr:3-dehydroquinate synthase [Planctomycetota bacterium]